MNASGRMSPLASVAEIDGVVRRVAAAREVLGDHGTWRSTSTAGSPSPTPSGSRRCSSRTDRSSSRSRSCPRTRTSSVSSSARPPRRSRRVSGSTAARSSCRCCRPGIAVAQPDLSHAGGITEVRKIAALAETFDVQLAPHCPLGPLALAACLQVGFATPNYLIQEQSIGIHYNQGAEVLDYVARHRAAAVRRRPHRAPHRPRPRHRHRRAGGPRRRQDAATPGAARSGGTPTARSRSGEPARRRRLRRRLAAARVVAIIRGTQTTRRRRQPAMASSEAGDPVRRGRADHARAPWTPSSSSRPQVPDGVAIGAGTVLTRQDVADVARGRSAVHRDPRGRGLHRRGRCVAAYRWPPGRSPRPRRSPRVARGRRRQALPGLVRRPRLPQGPARPAARTSPSSRSAASASTTWRPTWRRRHRRRRGEPARGGCRVRRGPRGAAGAGPRLRAGGAGVLVVTGREPASTS